MANTETGIYFIDYFRAKDNIEYKLDKINADANKKLIEVDVNTKIIEVNSGLCTGTLRGAVIETKINEMARQGWKFKQMKTIIGRWCLIFQRYKCVICFIKDN